MIDMARQSTFKYVYHGKREKRELQKNYFNINA